MSVNIAPDFERRVAIELHHDLIETASNNLGKQGI